MITNVALPPNFPLYLNLEVHGDPYLAEQIFVIGSIIKFQVENFWNTPMGQEIRLKMIQDDPDDWYAQQVEMMKDRAPA